MTTINTTLFIQRLTDMVNNDPAQGPLTVKKMDELANAYARDKFCSLNASARASKLKKIDRAIRKRIPDVLQYSAQSTVDRALAEPKLMAIQTERQAAAQKVAQARNAAMEKARIDQLAAQKAKTDLLVAQKAHADELAAQKARADLLAAQQRAQNPAQPQNHFVDARAQEQGDLNLATRITQLDAREQKLADLEEQLREQQQILNAQVASLNEWESTLGKKQKELDDAASTTGSWWSEPN